MERRRARVFIFGLPSRQKVMVKNVWMQQDVYNFYAIDFGSVATAYATAAGSAETSNGCLALDNCAAHLWYP